MSPFDELSNNDNTSAADDIVSESSGFKTSPADDLFDIIEPSEPVEEKKEDSGFVQDEDFLNSLDFINGFSDIDENATEAVKDNETDIQAVGDLDLDAILNEAASDAAEGMIADVPDVTEGMIADVPDVTEGMIADVPDAAAGMIADIPDTNDGMISDIPNIADGMIADTPKIPNGVITDIPEMSTDIPGMNTDVPNMGMDISNMSMDIPEAQNIADTAMSGISDINVDSVTDIPAEGMIADYTAAADIPSESYMAGIPDTAIPEEIAQEYEAVQPEIAVMPENVQAVDMQPATDYQVQEGMTDAYNAQQEPESAGDANNDEENEEEPDEDYYDDTEEEPMMIVTEGTTITGSIGTNTSMLILGSVNGDITCEGKLTISGKVIGNSFAMDVFVNSPRVEGNIGCTGTLKISQGTVVIGDISAGAAAIAGAVKGNLDITGPVILDSTAVIKGNIKAKSVQLINGAVLEGFCTLEYSDSQLDEIFANDAG